MGDCNYNKEKLVSGLRGCLREKIVKLDAPMKQYTSFKVGGPADALVQPHTVEDIKNAFACAKEADAPVHILGLGTNTIVRDGGIRGLVIRISDLLDGVTFEGNTISAACGARLINIAKEACKRKLGGLEFAGGIPGTLGGALYMNAGAYGGEMKNVVRSVTVFDGNEIFELDNEGMKFAYRESILKENQWVALSAVMELGENDRALELMKQYNDLRKEKQPLSYPSAGSVFKRPEGNYAGTLIEECGFKGKIIGGAKVSALHAGFIINIGKATASDAIKLMETVRHEVLIRTGVLLNEEWNIIGED